MIRYLKNYSIKNNLSILCKPLSFGSSGTRHLPNVHEMALCNIAVKSSDLNSFGLCPIWK